MPLCVLYTISAKKINLIKLGSVPTSTQMVCLRTVNPLHVSYCTCFIELLRLPTNSLHACAQKDIRAHTSVIHLHKATCVCTYICPNYGVFFTLKFMHLASIWTAHVKGKIIYTPDVKGLEQQLNNSSRLSAQAVGKQL